mmetsp:Transcript_101357/g.315960  ORF Transcript_101357/g.315960 Transcript_101357/m.315960 type:complete len:299 (-) Transcript_101357:35-931(-)
MPLRPSAASAAGQRRTRPTPPPSLLQPVPVPPDGVLVLAVRLLAEHDVAMERPHGARREREGLGLAPGGQALARGGDAVHVDGVLDWGLPGPELRPCLAPVPPVAHGDGVLGGGVLCELVLHAQPLEEAVARVALEVALLLERRPRDEVLHVGGLHRVPLCQALVEVHLVAREVAEGAGVGTVAADALLDPLQSLLQGEGVAVEGLLAEVRVELAVKSREGLLRGVCLGDGRGRERLAELARPEDQLRRPALHAAEVRVGVQAGLRVRRQREGGGPLGRGGEEQRQRHGAGGHCGARG